MLIQGKKYEVVCSQCFKHLEKGTDIKEGSLDPWGLSDPAPGHRVGQAGSSAGAADGTTVILHPLPPPDLVTCLAVGFLGGATEERVTRLEREGRLPSRQGEGQLSPLLPKSEYDQGLTKLPIGCKGVLWAGKALVNLVDQSSQGTCSKDVKDCVGVHISDSPPSSPLHLVRPGSISERNKSS